MKKLLQKLLFLLVLLPGMLLFPAQAGELELRGVWVSTVYQLDYPSASGLSAGELEAQARVIVDQAKSWGLNAVFLQVRPAGDAFYRSDFDPWSVWLTGTQGQAPAGGFDPLECFVRLCHEKGLQLHAWINPYRLTRKAAATREEAFAQLCESHPARSLSDCVVFHTDGCLYYDPGRPEVRDQIAKTAEELLTRYDIDGLHLDDYFYPSGDFADGATYARLGTDFSDIGDFRRDAVNQLIARLHDLTHALRPDAVFGVSPAGIWATAASLPQGAGTTGSQSYFDQFADSRKWVREGLVDYLVPQIYWEIGAAAGDFSVLLDWWSDAVRDTPVKLYIGLAAYKAQAAEPGTVWYGSEELTRQLDAIRASENALGAVFFRYSSLKSAQVAPCLAAFAEETVPSAAPWPRSLTVTSPETGTALTAGSGLEVICTAPRGSRVTAFWGDSYRTLRPDLRGNYRGTLPLEPDNAGVSDQPVLFCAEKHGMLFLKLSPGSAAAVSGTETARMTGVRLQEKGDETTVTFALSAPAAAQLNRTGDALTLALGAQDESLLPENPGLFSQFSRERAGNTVFYRLVLPDDGERRRTSLRWSEGEIILSVRPAPQDG